MRRLTIPLFVGLWLAGPAAAQDQLLSTLTNLERGFWDAHVRNDRAYFEANLADDAIDISSEGVTVGKRAIIDRIFSCNSGAYELEDWALHRIRDDVAIITFEAEYSVVCEGKTTQFEVVVSSTYARRGGQWTNVAYQETSEAEDD